MIQATAQAMIESSLFVFILGLCWGSFLNVVAFRLLNGYNLTTRSFCPHCKKTLQWYELIPVISWLILRSRCKSCKAPISWLYPVLEIVSGVLAFLLFLYVPIKYILPYAIFFSSLLVTIRSDLEALVIFRVTTWGLIPVGIIAAATGYLPITLTESIVGIIFGYTILWIVRKLFWLYRKQEGLGLGDLDLLALIGAFTGPMGAWAALFIGSLVGLVIGLFYACIQARSSQLSLRQIKIPFGPFLACGAIIYTFLPSLLEKIFMFHAL